MQPSFIIAACALAAATSLDVSAESFVAIGGGVSEWPSGTCVPSSACDRHDSAWLVRAGTMVVPYFGVDVRYVDLGKQSSSATSDQGGAPFVIGNRWTSKGFGVGAVAAIPVSGAFSFSATVGAARLKTTLDTPDNIYPATGGTVVLLGLHGSETHTDAYYGVGIDYRFAPNLSVGLDATRYRVRFADTDNVDTVTASVSLHF